MVQLIEPRQHRAFHDGGEQSHHQRCKKQREPIVDPTHGQKQQRDKGAQHVLRAMGEVDDAQKPEDHRKTQRQERVERAVDQSDQ